MKEFHMYFYQYPMNCLHTIPEVLDAIQSGQEMIHTTQLCEVTTDLITKYAYRIFIHPHIGETFELRLGNCPNTDKEIRPAHNLAKMLRAGSFDTDTTSCL